MEKDLLEKEKEKLCKIGGEICENSWKVGHARELHAALHRFASVATRVVEASTDPVFRKQLKLSVLELNKYFVEAQAIESETKESSLLFKNRLLRKVFELCTYVRRYKEHRPTRSIAQMFHQVNYGVSKVLHSDHKSREEIPKKGAIERLLNEIGARQRDKIDMDDLDTRLYKKLERPIEELKRSAYAGRKNVVRWSHFVEDMHELMTVANHLAQNSSLTISPYEQRQLNENVRDLTELIGVFYGLLYDTINLNIHPCIERASVLLTNTIYLLKSTINTELSVWNPVPKNLHFNILWQDQEQLISNVEPEDNFFKIYSLTFSSF